MGELTGSLIEMNVHMYRTSSAKVYMILGLIFTVAGVFSALLWFEYRKELKRKLSIAIAIALMLIVGIADIFYADSKPREKIVTACVNGPISLERISAVYDILEVDGKMLTLRER